MGLSRSLRAAPGAVTAVVPVYRGWDHASALLSGLRPADHPWLQVVLVDDASPDPRTRELFDRFPSIEIIVREVNGGFAAAVNTGLARAAGDVIAVLNSDVLISPTALRKLATAAAEAPTTIVGPRTVHPDGRPAITARRFPTLGTMLAEYYVPLRLAARLDGRLRDFDMRAHASTAPAAVDWLSGSCLVFHREVLERVGPLDEGFRMMSEEVDWQLRAARAGCHAAFHPEVTVVHDVGHGQRNAATDLRFRWLWASRFRYVAMHHGTVAVFALRIGMVAALLAMLPLWAVGFFLPRRRQQVRDQVRRHWEVLWLTH